MTDRFLPRSKKAFENEAFLAGPDARTLRMLAEFLEPMARFRRHNVSNTVVFFGSARIRSGEESQAALETAQTALAANPGDPQVARAVQAAQRAERLSRFYDDAVELARLLSAWSLGLPPERRRFHICSGGGPGIMEAANRGAELAGASSVGLNITLPFEQAPNPYITPELNFEFHYFFMRKFWFVYLGRALVAFPGGFGTLDELMEVLTLVQTRKIGRPLPILLYGSEYWNDVLNLEALVRWGTISPEDLDLLHFADEPQEAFTWLSQRLEADYLHPLPPRQSP